MINIPKGTKDVLPADSYKWQYVENVARETAKLFNVKEIRTPVFEHTELFQRGVGDTSDIVTKEMYTFKDKGDRSITLKPEGTAGVVRSFIENGLSNGVLPAKMYYIIPAFRYERPQAGRLREFHQFGVEVYGSASAQTDAETILVADTLLKKLGLQVQLYINSIGCPTCRAEYNNEDMTEVACLTVKDSYLIGAKYLRLELEENLPEMREGFTVENITQMPEFYVNNCISGFNRPRGILPSSPKKTRITNSTFFNMNTAIDFTGDSNNWFEAGGVRDVVISGNKFVNSAYAGGCVIAIAPHLNDKDTPYHQNILIENNYFELFDEDRFITAKNVDGLVMRNNTFHKNDTLPSHPRGFENGINLERSVTNSFVEPPKKI
jgi:hypothetical protein